MFLVPPKNLEDISVPYAGQSFLAVDVKGEEFINIVKLYFNKSFFCGIRQTFNSDGMVSSAFNFILSRSFPQAHFGEY